MLLTPIEDTELVRLDYVFLGSQWLQTHSLQARMTFSQLKEGSAQYDGSSLTEWIENYGATLSTQSTLSYSTVTVYCLHRHLHDIVRVIHSMLTEPLFPEDKFALALAQSRTKWQIQHQQVNTLCKEAFYRQLYGEQHPMGRFPTLSDYETLTTQQLRDFYHSYIHSSYQTLLLTGSYDDEDLRWLDTYAATDGATIPLDSVFPPCQPLAAPERSQTIHTGQGHVQAAVRMGCLLPPADHPDMPLIRLAVTILGGYFGSRLMSNIRERRGLTYGINATIYNIPHDNALVIACETATPYADEVLSEVRAELQRLCTERVGEDELQMVKQYMYGQACRRYERSFNYPSVLMGLLPTGRSFADLELQQTLIREASAEQVLDIAQRYLCPDCFIQCVVD